MTSTPSLRSLWTMYKNLLIEEGMSRRDKVLAQAAFYAGVGGVLQSHGVLGEMVRDRRTAAIRAAGWRCAPCPR
jgi:hypothetical protein